MSAVRVFQCGEVKHLITWQDHKEKQQVFFAVNLLIYINRKKCYLFKLSPAGDIFCGTEIRSDKYKLFSDSSTN